MRIACTNDTTFLTCNPVLPAYQVEQPTHSSEDPLAPTHTQLKPNPRREITNDGTSRLDFMSLQDKSAALDPWKVDGVSHVNDADAQS